MKSLERSINVIDRIKFYISLIIFRKKWKKKNQKNSTFALNMFEMQYVHIGRGTYGGLRIYNDSDKNLYIGSFCSIAENVVFLLGHEHYVDRLSTYPFKQRLGLSSDKDAFSKGDIIVDDDVWLGYGVTIMSNVHIGQGAVVAAGAVVTKDVPPYAIVGGVPAKVLKYRFEPEMIEELLKINFSILTKEMIEEHVNDLYTKLKTPKQLNWIIRKE